MIGEFLIFALILWGEGKECLPYLSYLSPFTVFLFSKTHKFSAMLNTRKYIHITLRQNTHNSAIHRQCTSLLTPLPSRHCPILAVSHLSSDILGGRILTFTDLQLGGLRLKVLRSLVTNYWCLISSCLGAPWSLDFDRLLLKGRNFASPAVSSHLSAVKRPCL